MSQPRLDMLADETSFWFQAPPGEPLNLDQFFGKQREALERLLQQRFPLSEGLQRRIRAYEKNRSTRGFCCQLAFGLLLPSGLLTQGEWDYDRDMAVLRREAATVLSAQLGPERYELQERIDSEGSFRQGKALFVLYLC